MQQRLQFFFKVNKIHKIDFFFFIYGHNQTFKKGILKIDLIYVWYIVAFRFD